MDLLDFVLKVYLIQKYKDRIQYQLNTTVKDNTIKAKL